MITVHEKENNKESQNNLDENRIHFNRQCRKIMQHMLTGRKINGDTARNLYGVRHLPRRIKDLKDNGMEILGEMNPKTRLKDYWMSEEERSIWICRIKEEVK